ncbi:sigma-70 family RNA polymerase sigma factor [Eubacterium sp. MSJ-21]|nr:sigma-70 family RNA polymerase sigma factor [Eubacterium sp. MSJ-21]
MSETMKMIVNMRKESGLLTAEQEQALGARRMAGGADGAKAREEMIKANLGLVAYCAKDYEGRGVEEEDLLAMGITGLIRAVDRFDYTRGYRFSTFAVNWIRQAILRGMKDSDKTIRLPEYMATNIARIRREAERIKQKTGSEATLEELSEATGMDQKKIRLCMEYGTQNTVSLDAVVGEDGDTSRGELIADEKATNPEKAVLDEGINGAIRTVLTMLPEKEAAVLTMRYGLDGSEPMTLEQVAKHPQFGLTRERIRQIENRAINRIRHSYKMKEQLCEYAS